MARLNEFQIAGYALAAGFPPNEIATATAVALAESGGNTDAQNRNTNGSYDYGLFQINTVHGALLNQGNKFNPLDNAKMALTVWRNAGNKWTPWTVYKSGTYRAQLLKGTAGAAKPAAIGAAPAAEFQPPLVSPEGEPLTDPEGNVPIPGQGGPLEAAVGMLGDAAASLKGLNDTLMTLVSGGFWLRVGAFIVGSLLIAVSLIKLTGAQNMIPMKVPGL